METFRPPGECAIPSVQIPSELAAFCNRVREIEPHAVLEIGTAQGGTLFLLAEAASRDALLITLDLPHPGGYRRHRGLLYRRFARGQQRVLPLRSDSHDAATVDLVREALDGRPLDLLFIDGDHASEGVARDYELYAPLVRSGGLIAFHDIVPGPREGPGDVPMFWHHLKESAHDGWEEIVESWEQGGFGIGLLNVRGGC